MFRRGFTLLEVLIAIGLALALLALAIPPLTGALDRRAFESAADNTLNQLLLARAQAQITGRAVEVVYHPRTRLVEARRFDPGAFDDELPAPDSAADTRASSGDDAERAIAEAWATVVLPKGLRLTDQAPESDDDLAAAPDTLRPPIPATVSETGDSLLRLAVFMPDGSALLGRDHWLTDGAARRATISINPWTGLPSVTEGVAGTPPPEPASDDEADDEALDDEPPLPEDLPDEPADDRGVEDDDDGADPGDDPTTDPDEKDPAR